MAATTNTPDYFGTIPNYANSPLPVSVSIIGDGDGALARAVVSGGRVIGINVVNPGNHYTAAFVNVVGGGGSAATGIATISGGQIASIAVDKEGSGYGTVPGIRKFVDSLALPGNKPNNLGQYIPVAVPDTATYTKANGFSLDSDYYEVAVVQYTERMHSDLPPTTLRGYVQLETAVVKGKHVALTYPDGRPIHYPGTTTQVYAVDQPHYLGPVITAQKDWPVRVKFYNLLPTGVAGNLFIPSDPSITGAGDGPVTLPNSTLRERYTENRATLHLHGGITPWISDGTQHQWTTPANEITSYPKGVSVGYVPDMPQPVANDGTLTFYYTNQQGARLMWYHDHSYGITRLNVYAGELAPYILTDATEAQMVSTGVLPPASATIPLVIQDKTFVPTLAQLAAQDPTWDVAKHGGYGSLWWPHVYMPNQNPYDVTGANVMGRWDYGPWFWPPFTGITQGAVPNPLYDPTAAPWEPPYIPGTPNPSDVPESFMDTAVVNGTVYPTLSVDPVPYRFKILNGANDRFWNLSLWMADPGVVTSDLRSNTEVKMVPFNSTQDKLTPFPDWWYTPGLHFVFDDRNGGVPDPTTRGPAMIQIGTEGGFLPAPVVIKNQPVNFNYNRRDITVLNVLEHALLLAPAERADIVVDFSKFAGKTLILYNDAPAPVPAADPRLDYFTGDMDETSTGGAPSTLPGFGPNTRTIMQIQVRGSDGTAPVDYVDPMMLASLQAHVSAAYAINHERPLVPQQQYNLPFAAAFPDGNYGRIQDTSMTFFNGPVSAIKMTNSGSGYTTLPNVYISGGGGSGASAVAQLAGAPVTSIALTNPGTGYRTIPTVTISGGGGSGATASASIGQNGRITAINLTNGGGGYTSRPTVTISGGGGSGATATATLGTGTSGILVRLVSGGNGYTFAPTVTIDPPPTGGTKATSVALGTTILMQPKSIIESFDPKYGRMNSLLGVEVPNTSAAVQTSIPYEDVEPPTELFTGVLRADTAMPVGVGADGTQIWKITHNGVDTHAMHWHMFDVQLINRVGWDGAIKPPEDNELGWKDTIRMNPLEDIVVAMRPILPDLPWDLPNSVRPLDPTQPLGTTTQFLGVDPTNQPARVTNSLVNFGYEYLWHCHLLGHEENVMMRPMAVAAPPKVPGTPTVSARAGQITVTWTDNSLNETAFTVQRATSLTGPWTDVTTVAAHAGTGTMTATDRNPVRRVANYYRIVAKNTVGYTQTYAAPAVGYPKTTATSISVVSAGVTP
jgi:FtsP/CotA-like multicopper oxidase with cupredoxin domain